MSYEGTEWEESSRSLVNDSSLQLEFARLLHKGFFVYVMSYDSETMI